MNGPPDGGLDVAMYEFARSLDDARAEHAAAAEESTLLAVLLGALSAPEEMAERP